MAILRAWVTEILSSIRQPYPPDLVGTSLALYVIRLLTLGMAVATVAAVYQAARTIMPDHVGFAVLATSLVAFNPMFIFISTSITNDVMVTALSTLAVWQMLVMLRRGFRFEAQPVLGNPDRQRDTGKS